MSAERLIGYPGGLDLGPEDHREWLASYLWREPTHAQRRMVGPLAERIAAAETDCLKILEPDDAEPLDWVEQRDIWDYRRRHHLSMLGIHAAAARYAVRAAAAQVWQNHRHDVPTKKEHRERMTRVAAAVRELRAALDELAPMERVSFAFFGSSADPQLACDPDGIDPAPLMDMLDKMGDEADRSLARLGEPNTGDWRPHHIGLRLCGAAKTADYAAGTTFFAYKHFRQDRRPSSKEDSPFVLFTELVVKAAVGRSISVRRAAGKFLRELGEDINLFY